LIKSPTAEIGMQHLYSITFLCQKDTSYAFGVPNHNQQQKEKLIYFCGTVRHLQLFIQETQGLIMKTWNLKNVPLIIPET